MKSEFRRDIEGVRAIAVALVIAFHAKLPFVSGGFIGVDVFFVLSGYLITLLLLREHAESGRIAFASFYARRARRLLPAAGCVAVVTLLVGSFIYSPDEQANHAESALATFAYVSNLRFARFSQDYFAPETERDPFLHAWSLAVEEQFYLLWPLLLTFSFRRSSQNLAAIVGTVTIASFLVCVVLTELRPQWAFFLMPTRAWEFGVGALAAILPITPFEIRKCVPLRWLALASLVGTSVVLSEQTGFPGVAAVLPAISTASLLRLGALGIPGLPEQLFRLAPVQWMGRVSYGLYLWHWPVFGVAGAIAELTIVHSIVLIVVTMLAADLMYRTLETPIRQSVALQKKTALTLALAGAFTIGGVLLSGVASVRASTAAEAPAAAQITQAIRLRPGIDQADCVADFTESDVVECSFGDTTSETVVVLYGDSHAAQWFPALESIANERRWRLITLVKSACPVAEIRVLNTRLHREFVECPVWRTAAVKRILALRPQALIVANFTAGYTETIVGPAGEENGEAVARGLRYTLELFDAAGIQTLFLRDSPHPGFDVPSCVSRAIYHQGDHSRCAADMNTARNRGVAQIERAAAVRLSHVTLVDLTMTICPTNPCEALHGQIIKYRDGHHLSVPFVLTLTKRLEPALLASMTRSQNIGPESVEPEQNTGNNRD